MSRWFRHYAGLTADPKFGGIARRAKATKERVVFVWCCLLESAAEGNAGGAYTIDADSIADLLGCETSDVEAITKQLKAAGLIAEGRVAKWATRQFENDTSASRTRRYREKKRHGDVTATDSDGDVTSPDTETDTDTDTERAIETPVTNPVTVEDDVPADASRRTGSTAGKYAFEHGTFRLTQAHLDRWIKAWPELNVIGLLHANAAWAIETGNPYVTMPKLLAKKDEERKLAVEQIKATAIAAANAPAPKKPAYLGP